MLLEIDQLTDLHAKECTMPLPTYRKYTSPKSLDSVAIANKENAKSHSDHSTTEPNDSYCTRHGLQCLTRTSMIEEWITDAYWIMYRIMYELAVCSDGMTEAQPRSFRQNRPASEYII